MDEETERVITESGSLCEESDHCKFCTESRNALRLRIAQLISEARNIGYANGQLSGVESYRKEGWK